MNGSDNKVMDADILPAKSAGGQRLFVVLLALVLGGTGCDQKPPEGAERLQSQAAASDAASAGVVKPGAGEKVCFQCNGTGQTTCFSPGCKDGWVDCPGPCLKLSKGTWEHMHVDGHPDTDVWQRFHQADGTSQWWNQGHVGEVIEMRAGMAVDIGKCPVCGGRGRVSCKACNGTGKSMCPICEGKKVVPDSWTAFNNPKLKNPPAMIQLKDGRTIFGKIESRLGATVYVRTESGKQEEFQARDIVSPATK